MPIIANIINKDWMFKCFSALITVGLKVKLFPNVTSVTVELLFKCLSP